MEKTQIILILVLIGAVLLTVLLCHIYETRRSEKKVKYMLDALSDGELNFRFREGRNKNSLNVLLNRLKSHFDAGVQKTIEDKEAESWTKLIRVLTHEIMNTVTPISALSKGLKDASEEDMKEGLKTISESSDNLLSFVQSYRDLTRLQQPVRKAMMVSELVGKVISLEQPSFPDLEMQYREKDKDILIYADEGQISRILINLIRNAAQAGARRVVFTAWINPDDSVALSVANDGEQISEKTREEIFVPFFTTKADGSGIGLSVSRQIMRMHSGALRLESSTPEWTTFTLTFK